MKRFLGMLLGMLLISLTSLVAIPQEAQAFVEWWTGNVPSNQLPEALKEWFTPSDGSEAFAAWWTGESQLKVQLFTSGMIGITVVSFCEYIVSFTPSVPIIWRIAWSNNGEPTEFIVAEAGSLVQFASAKNPMKCLILYAPLSEQDELLLTFILTAP